MSEAWFLFLWFLVVPLFTLLHPRKVIGREKVPSGAALLCCNHTTMSDPFYVAFALGRHDHPRVMAKAELMKLPVLGFLMRKAGAFGVDRGKSDIKAVKEAIRVLKEGAKLLIFPEGTRVKEGESQEAKTGVAMLALRTGVPIVPVWVPAKKRWFRPTPVVFGDPYYPPPPANGRHATPEEYHAIADDLLARIRALGEEYNASHAG